MDDWTDKKEARKVDEWMDILMDGCKDDQIDVCKQTISICIF